MARIIEVVPYCERWPIQFAEEAVRLLGAMGGACLGIAHVGSTSIPGLPAKPTVDILATVFSFEALEAQNAWLLEAGYCPRGENGIPGRRYYVRTAPDNPEKHLFHLHCFVPGHRAAAELLLFRDFLRQDAAAREEYAALKTALAARFRHDPPAYTEAKGAFVRECVRKAEEIFGFSDDFE